MPRRRPPLSEAQLEMMNVLWERGGGTVADVVDRLAQRRPVSRNTVQTTLSRLEKKGWLTHRDENGAFVFSPAVSREAARDEMLRKMVDTVFDGSAAGILATLLQERSLSKEEARRIRRMIKEAEERS